MAAGTRFRPALAAALVLLASALPCASAGTGRANTADFVGERLRFDVSWGAMTVGHADMSVLSTQMPGVALIRTRATGNNFLQKMYPVHDTVESVVSIETGRPYTFEKRLHEGGYSARFRTTFDRNRLVARVQGAPKGKTLADTTLSISAEVHDVLSSFYWARTQELVPGSSVYTSILDNRRLFQKVEIKCHRRETVEVPAGKFPCLVVEPLLHSEGLFRAKGRLLIWLTDDARRMPVLMTSKISIGSIRAELVRAQLPPAGARVPEDSASPGPRGSK